MKLGIFKCKHHLLKCLGNFLFSRVIPNLSRIGLLTDEIRPKFEALGLVRI
jgi:hypothetical protein